jgi:hypothetical protein
MGVTALYINLTACLIIRLELGTSGSGLGSPRVRGLAKAWGILWFAFARLPQPLRLRYHGCGYINITAFILLWPRLR